MNERGIFPIGGILLIAGAVWVIGYFTSRKAEVLDQGQYETLENKR